jgi:hypothetical protein
MTEIEAKALALVNEVLRERDGTSCTEYTRLRRDHDDGHEALCRAIEQHEAFKQEVSDAVVEYFGPKHLDVILAGHRLNRFIIPKPKADPLVAVVYEVDNGPAWDSPEDYCNKIRDALDARGLEIRSKSDDR